MHIIAMLLLAWWGARKDRAVPVQVVEPIANDKFKRTEVPFAPGEPTTFDEYKGQEHAKRICELCLDTLATDNHRPRLLFAAPKGVGKTALAKVHGKEFLERWRQACITGGVQFTGKWMEATPAMFTNKADLDEFMASVGLFDVVFFDEIHMFDRHLADTLLPAIAENRYPFPSGMEQLPPYYCLLGATTDVGLLPEAFQDRWRVVQLRPLEVPDLVNIVKMQPRPVTDDAAIAIANRAVGYAREIKRIYSQAAEIASVRNSITVESTDAFQAFDLLGLDDNGLYPIDRSVLEVLFYRPKSYAPRRDGTIPMRYAQSERTIRTITGLDERLYATVEAKLLRLNYLTISSAGRELTDKALETYFSQEHK